MDSLLDLDQIIIHEQDRKERVRILYDEIHTIYEMAVKWGKPLSNETRQKYNDAVSELWTYGYAKDIICLMPLFS